MILNKLNENELEDDVLLNKKVMETFRISDKITLIRVADLLNPDESYWDSEVFNTKDAAMEHIYDVHSLLAFDEEDVYLDTTTVDYNVSLVVYCKHTVFISTHDDGLEIKVYPIKNGRYSVDISRHIRVFALTYKLEE